MRNFAKALGVLAVTREFIIGYLILKLAIDGWVIAMLFRMGT
jgi:hypothetical protein